VESLDSLRFTPELMAKPARTTLTTETTLKHFVTVTYTVDPDALRRHLHPRFEPDCIRDAVSSTRALVSVVTFLDRDFRLAAFPWFKSHFGQTNYRSYVLDTETGRHVAWFFGTCLDSAAVAVPRHLWRLPWHRCRMEFDCRYDDSAKRYACLEVRTQSRWAPAMLKVDDSGTPPSRLPGFATLEAGLVLLSQPTRGFYFRRDGVLGSYSIWHDRLRQTQGSVSEASFGLLHDLELVPLGDRGEVHSVLIQPSVDFTIYLPPRRVGDGRAG
jgi:uncharacterized protein DUF2071